MVSFLIQKNFKKVKKRVWRGALNDNIRVRDAKGGGDGSVDVGIYWLVIVPSKMTKMVDFWGDFELLSF